ncbi:MAG: hypothetical protein SPI26_03145, partial [Oscillospiraceae bacterium]|nr:hypothetical protein [Oscillospiraceae bacterium]
CVTPYLYHIEKLYLSLSAAYLIIVPLVAAEPLSANQSSLSILTEKHMFPCFPQDVTKTIIPLFAEVNVTL